MLIVLYGNHSVNHNAFVERRRLVQERWEEGTERGDRKNILLSQRPQIGSRCVPSPMRFAQDQEDQEVNPSIQSRRGQSRQKTREGGILRILIWSIGHDEDGEAARYVSSPFSIEWITLLGTVGEVELRTSPSVARVVI